MLDVVQMDPQRPDALVICFDSKADRLALADFCRKLLGDSRPALDDTERKFVAAMLHEATRLET